MKEKNQFTPVENFQLWAEHYKINSVTYSVEVNSSKAYFREYANYPQINYWEWFVIPRELIVKPTFNVLKKPHLLKKEIPKKIPLLFSNRTIVPLRI